MSDSSQPSTVSPTPETKPQSPVSAAARAWSVAAPGRVVLPGYEVLGELGRGGMGVVYQARQIPLKRLVALKMILAGGHASEADLARFKTEAEAVARLQHPNIVQIYEVGEQDGLPYFSLEYCPGGSLADKLDGTPLPAQEAAQLLRTLALAVQAAHQAGIIHRDLKPANVLLGAEGMPKLADFGLAKKLDEGPGLTQSNALVGTPSYMAPEQAEGRAREVGPGTDIWALGAVLYELLTGRPPFKAATLPDTLLQVVQQEPVPPRQLQAGLPRDLETICLQCLEKEPCKRYPTAAALARDLDNFLGGKPISARPISAVARAGKWARRRPAVAALLLCLLAVVLGSLIGLTVLWLDAAAATRVALQQQALVAQERDRALDNLHEARQQRDRAHFYLESFLNLSRFGRSLLTHPLRQDFDLRVRLLNGERGETTRGQVSLGEFDPSLPFYLSLESDQYCHVNVFYALPEKVRGLASEERCLLVYPNQHEKDNAIHKGVKRVVLNHPDVFLSPVVCRGDVAYLYVLATERDWKVKPDRTFHAFSAFSPAAEATLAGEIRALVEGTSASATGEKGRIAEEIVIFNVRPDRR